MWLILQQEKPDDYVIATGEIHSVREFLHVDDLADAVVYLMNNYGENEPLNIGTGKDITIKELAESTSPLVLFTISFILLQSP